MLLNRSHLHWVSKQNVKIVLMELVQNIIQWIQIHSIYISSQEEKGSEMEYDFEKTKKNYVQLLILNKVFRCLLRDHS